MTQFFFPLPPAQPGSPSIEPHHNLACPRPPCLARHPGDLSGKSRFLSGVSRHFFRQPQDRLAEVLADGLRGLLAPVQLACSGAAAR